MEIILNPVISSLVPLLLVVLIFLLYINMVEFKKIGEKLDKITEKFNTNL